VTKQDLLDTLGRYFPVSFSSSAEFPQSEVGSIVIERLLNMGANPLTCTHLNQLLHMMHEVGMSDGFFNYYFVAEPRNHPYASKTLLSEPFEANAGGVQSLRQIRWALQRFFTDGLLYFGSV
jgi:hypothetical protein